MRITKYALAGFAFTIFLIFAVGAVGTLLSVVLATP